MGKRVVHPTDSGRKIVKGAKVYYRGPHSKKMDVSSGGRASDLGPRVPFTLWLRASETSFERELGPNVSYTLEYLMISIPSPRN